MLQVSDKSEYDIETYKDKDLLKKEITYKTLSNLNSMGYTNFSDVEQFRQK